MTTNLVDFHCHLDLYSNHLAVIADCEREGIHTLSVTTTPKAWPRNHELAAKTRYVRVALGLHPQLVAERAEELQLWEDYLPQARYVGEVGLDAGTRFYRSFELQKKVFERILKLCALAGNKILTIHSSRAASTVLGMIEMHLPPNRGQVVLHWFSGNRTEAKRAVELGCYFSVNAEMLKNDSHRDLFSELPLDCLLTETDGPFCKRRGRPLHPRDSSIVVDLLAQVRGIEPESIAAAILSNLRRIESF